MSMAAKSSDLVDETSGANLQMEDHADVHPKVQKVLWESETSDSSPCHLPSWSLARRLPSSHPNMRHCLEIHVTLTEELGQCPHPFIPGWHPSWKICCMMVGLDSVVIGPVRAVIFYGRHLMGEGLPMDEARDAKFLLIGACT